MVIFRPSSTHALVSRQVVEHQAVVGLNVAGAWALEQREAASAHGSYHYTTINSRVLMSIIHCALPISARYSHNLLRVVLLSIIVLPGIIKIHNSR